MGRGGAPDMKSEKLKVEVVEMNDEFRGASEGVAIKLMVAALQESTVDLTDMAAVRKALVAARFGERLIVNCAERAAARARELQAA